MSSPARRAFDPFRSTPEREDPTIRAFLEAGVDIGKPKEQLTLSGIPIDLTPAEQREWQRLRGEQLERIVPPLLGRPFWTQPLQREKAMQDVLSQSGEAADQRLKASIGQDELRRRVREAAEKRKGS